MYLYMIWGKKDRNFLGIFGVRFIKAGRQEGNTTFEAPIGPGKGSMEGKLNNTAKDFSRKKMIAVSKSSSVGLMNE